MMRDFDKKKPFIYLLFIGEFFVNISMLIFQ